MFFDPTELKQLLSLLKFLDKSFSESRSNGSAPLTYEIKVTDCNGDYAGTVKLSDSSDPSYVFYAAAAGE